MKKVKKTKRNKPSIKSVPTVGTRGDSTRKLPPKLSSIGRITRNY